MYKMMINFDKDKNLASINEKSRQKIWLILKKTLPLHRFSRKALKFGLWCNGSTTGFGSVCLGSNPGRTTTKNEVDNYLPRFLLSGNI